MAIFSKKTLQEAIWRVKPFLTPKHLEDFVRELNKTDEKSISSEWELILLDVFSNFGVIEHETMIEGKRPDFIVLSPKTKECEFIADAITVSDNGLKEGIITVFKKKFREELNKRKLILDWFSWEFGHIDENSGVEDFLTIDLLDFLDELTKNKKNKTSYESKDNRLKIKYHPNSNQTTRSRIITSHKKLVNNPFFNSLEKKHKQLKKIPDLPKGIILCDGGSEMFIFRETCPIWWGSDDIIRNFLRNNLDINFVLTVWVDRKPITSKYFLNEYPIQTQLFENSSFSELSANAQIFLKDVSKYFPKAILPVDSVLDNIYNSKISYIAGKQGLIF